MFTFKEGLLSRLAHDLQLSLERFEIELERGSVSARFWPAALRVDGAVRDGRVVRGLLDAGDLRKISRTIDDEVLHTRRFGEVTLTGAVNVPREHTFVLDGQVAIMGREVAVRGTLRERDGRLSTSMTLIPSRWGIRPYRALRGALKLQDRVIVEVDLDATVEGLDLDDPLTSTCRWVAGGSQA